MEQVLGMLADDTVGQDGIAHRVMTRLCIHARTPQIRDMSWMH
jgi:hypothetical protein